MTSAPQGPQSTAGWYPDPEQVGTVRFWDGEGWTDQRAPATVQPAEASTTLSLRPIIGALGAIAAAVGVFVPQLDGPTSLHITDNAIIASDLLVGVVALSLALAGGIGSLRARNDPDRYVGPVIVGILLIAAAIYMGTGSRTELEATGGLLDGTQFHGSPGIGLYILGVGGALVAIAGLIPGNPAGSDNARYSA